MRIFTLLILLLIQTTCIGQTEKGISLKVQYKPEKKYVQTIQLTSRSSLKYSGSEELLEQVKKEGLKNPDTINKVHTVESTIKTGKIIDSINIPLTMEFTETVNGVGKKTIPDKALIYGHSSATSIITLDSIASSKLDQESKNKWLKNLQNIYSQFSFPEKLLKVGESFSVETPITVPFAGEKAEISVTTNYKLLSITNDIADIEISQVFHLKSSNTKYTIKATGSGKGKLLYDVSKSFYINFQLNSDIVLSMKIEGLDIELHSKNDTVQSVVIKEN